MTRPIPFTQAQVTRAIAAAKKAGLRVIGIRPDGTIIVYDGKGPIEKALRSALGCETQPPADNEWDAVSAFDERREQQYAQGPGRVLEPDEAPLAGAAWRERVEKWKVWVRGRPLGVREKSALRELFAIKGRTPRHINGAGPDTMDKLEAREFIRPVGEVRTGYFPMYEITPTGEAAWQRICGGA
jgi:hypothetical protein